MKYITNVTMFLIIFSLSYGQEKMNLSMGTFKTLGESFKNIASEKTVFIIPERTDALDFVVNYTLGGVNDDKYNYQDIPDSILSQCNIIVIGLEEENLLVKKCLKEVPIKLDTTSITIGDNKFFGDDIGIIFRVPNPFNAEKECIVVTGNMKEYYFAGIRGSYKGSFAVKRKSDGLYRYEDHLATGNFKFEYSKIVVDSIEILKRETQELTKISSENSDLLYRGINTSDAEKILNFITKMRNIISDYGIVLNKKFTVYIYPEASDDKYPTTYTDAFNTFWSKFNCTGNELFRPEDRLIIRLAHETARLTFQPKLKTPKNIARITTPYDDSWSHYFQFTVLIPGVWKQLGINAWPIPFNYNKEFGEEFFNNIYKGCDQTYASILYKIDKKYGKKIIANTINELTNNGRIRYYLMEDFMNELAKRTGDQEIISYTAESITSYMEWRYGHRIEPLGFTPSLDDMMWSSDFEVSTVEPNSPADEAGLKHGDVFIEFNGYNLATQKNFAQKKGLEMIAEDGWFTFKIKRNKKIVEINIAYKIK